MFDKYADKVRRILRGDARETHVGLLSPERRNTQWR